MELDEITTKIKETEEHMQKLVSVNDKMVAEFNQQLAINKSEYSRLQGRLDTLRELLPKQEPVANAPSA